VTVADPMYPNPRFAALKYNMSVDRVIGAVLLGILTYDANLLVIEPGPKGPGIDRAARTIREGPRERRPSRLSRAGEMIGRTKGKR
jgi:hypothetical protein